MIKVSNKTLAVKLFEATTYKALAIELECSEGYLSNVANGFKRPQVKGLIAELEDESIEDAVSLVKRHFKSLMAKQIKSAMGDDETARKSRERLINQMLGDPSKAATTITNVNEAKAASAIQEEVNDNAIGQLLTAYARGQSNGGGGSKKQGSPD